jgi:hypothetical protein
MKRRSLLLGLIAFLLASQWAYAWKHGTVTVSAIPAGVTLQAIDGGTTYYASNGFTYAANAGWDSPSFYPIGQWFMQATLASDYTSAQTLGWNTWFVVTSTTSTTLARSATPPFWILQDIGPDAGQTTDPMGTETVGLLTLDEPGKGSGTYTTDIFNTIHTTLNVPSPGPTGLGQDGRTWWGQYTNAWLSSTGGIPGGPGDGRPVTMLQTMIATPNATVRHQADQISWDTYYLSCGRAGSANCAAGFYGAIQALINTPTGATDDQIKRGHHYGDQIDYIRDGNLAAGRSIPIFSLIEDADGAQFTAGNPAWNVTPNEMSWSFWSSIIHGARGTVVFDATSPGWGGGSCSKSCLLFNSFLASVYTQHQADITRLGTVLSAVNAPFALNYVTVNPSGYVFPNRNNSSVCDCIDTMAKYYNGAFYVFADTRASELTTNISATFTIADFSASSVTVVGESRSISVTSGQFTDTFANAWTTHIYKVNGPGIAKPDGGFITTYLAGSGNWTVPANWNNANNTIELIGGGGAGAAGDHFHSGGGGGGAGQYCNYANVTYTPSASIAYVVGTGGTGGTGSGPNGTASSINNNSAGNLGTANPGSGGTSSTSGVSGGGAGGTGGCSGATSSANGGSGGNADLSVPLAGSGAGAGGPNGAGANGVSVTAGAFGLVTGGLGGGGSGGGTTGNYINTATNNSIGTCGGNNSAGYGGACGGWSALAAGNPGFKGGGGGGGGSSSGSTAGAGAGGPGGIGNDWGDGHGPGGGGGGGGETGGSGGVPPGAGGAGGVCGGGGGGGGHDAGTVNANGGSGAAGCIRIRYHP